MTKSENNADKMREFVCICCPIGCRLNATRTGDEITVTGNTCKRGYKYAVDEMTAPKRTVTTTVRITGGEFKVLPVKTECPIPKESIFKVLRAVKSVTATAPVNIGDVIVKDVCGTGVDVVATRDCAIKNS